MWNVIGHPGAVALLSRSLDAGRLAHAYLLVGQPHAGKTTLALSLAQALNCEQEERPCGRCSSCVRIATGKHADVQVIGRLADSSSGQGPPRKEIGISQIRELQKAAALQPYEGTHRVFIVDGAEYLNDESANCLLKTLEEPPQGVFIVLLTVNDAALLPTIVSRCQRIELLPIAPHVVEQALVAQWQVAPEKARVLGRLCRGGIGWAISALLDESVVEERSVRLAELQGITAAGLEQRFDFAARLAAQFSRDRDSVREVLGLWVEWWRDLLLASAGCVQLATNLDQQATLLQQSGDYALSEIRASIEAIRVALRQMEQNANARLALEVLMLSIPSRAGEERAAHAR